MHVHASDLDLQQHEPLERGRNRPDYIHVCRRLCERMLERRPVAGAVLRARERGSQRRGHPCV